MLLNLQFICESITEYGTKGDDLGRLFVPGACAPRCTNYGLLVTTFVHVI